MKNIITSVSSFFGFGNVVVQEVVEDTPLLRNISSDDAEIQQAHALAKESIDHFISFVKKQKDVIYMAKLRFKEPDFSENKDKNEFSYIWLTEVIYHPDEGILSGIFFELPKALQKWYQTGQRLGFDPEDAFDWMVNDNGKVNGGFTLQVTRSYLETESEKLAFDKYVGISAYETVH